MDGPERLMSLPSGQQQTLDRIGKTLLASDPGLGSLFAIFTRLTWHEAMPRIEQVSPGRWWSLRPFAAIAIAVTAALGVLMLGLLAPARPTCVASAAAGHSYVQSRTTGCPTNPANPARQTRQHAG
jgi:hypothetical protein